VEGIKVEVNPGCMEWVPGCFCLPVLAMVELELHTNNSLVVGLVLFTNWTSARPINLP
jgi:hypothetical protein